MQDQDTGIRVGDVFALMIEYWYEQRNAAQAYKLVEQMRSRNIILSPYLDQRMLEDIYKVGGSGHKVQWPIQEMNPVIDHDILLTRPSFSPTHYAFITFFFSSAFPFPSCIQALGLDLPDDRQAQQQQQQQRSPQRGAYRPSGDGHVDEEEIPDDLPYADDE